MRLVFLIVLIAGLAAGVVYPWAVQNFSGRELGTWRVFDTGTGFIPANVPLARGDAPLRVLVDLRSNAQPPGRPTETVLTLTATIAGRTVLASTLDFVDAPVRDDSPQTVEKIYRDDAGVIEKLDDGDYLFVVGPGDREDIPIRAVDVVLRAGASVYDPRAQPIGFTLMAVGFIGFVLSLRGRSSRREPPPPPPRWGRQSGEGP
ncbi:MAG: hypothetical protein AB7I79_06530 [Rhizobiaceae bacterium]